MITREKLQKLSNLCLSLLTYSENIGTEDVDLVRDSNDSITKALRKIILANEMSKKNIICVTGLQGAGKTTLMKNYFDLDDKIMNITTVRGERIPILITESEGVDVPELYTVSLKKEGGRYINVRSEVNGEEFKKSSSAKDEKSKTMYLEILVPLKYQEIGNTSFMLLPGYERKNDYWRSLIDFSIACSGTAIFVLTDSSLADNENNEIMNEVKTQFKDNLVYAISYSDKSKDNNEGTKRTLMNVMGISQEEVERVVCIGEHTSKEHNDIWKNQLTKAISMFQANPESVINRNIDYIIEVIINEIEPCLQTIGRASEDGTREFLINSENTEAINVFDKAYKKMRKSYLKTLDDSFTTTKIEDIDNLRDEIEKESFFSGFKIIKNDVKNIKEAKARIHRAMTDSEGEYRFRIAFYKSILKSTATNIYEMREIEAKSNNSKNDKLLLDVRTILSNNKNEYKAVNIGYKESDFNMNFLSDNSSIDEIMKTLVDCATAYFGMQIIDKMDKNMINSISEEFKSEEMSVVIENFIDSKDKVDNFFKFSAAILGSDVAIDGESDISNNLAEYFNISPKLMGGVIAAVMVAKGTIDIINEFNKVKANNYYAGVMSIENIYDEIKSKYVELYDDYMSEIRENVETYLKNSKGLGTIELNKLNTNIAITNIKAELKDIKKEIRKGRNELFNMG